MFTKWKCKVPHLCQCKVQNTDACTQSHIYWKTETLHRICEPVVRVGLSKNKTKNAATRENGQKKVCERVREETKSNFQMNSIQKKPMYKGKSERKANISIYEACTRSHSLRHLLLLFVFCSCFFSLFVFSWTLFACFFFSF